jgi:aerobic carbon-monoxide dehydrogenase medium subunit
MGYGYHRPSTLDEAFRLAAEIPDFRYVAGGTDLFVQMGNGRPEPAALISLRGLSELSYIETSTRVKIGAAVPLSDVQAHPAVAERFPALVESITSLGSRQIRNMGTVGGNLCNASPAADTAPPLLVYGASVELADSEGSREVTLEDFLQGPCQTALRPDEILTAILLDPPADGAHSVFLRKGRVAMDLPISSVAALVEWDGATCLRVRLAAGAVAPVPLRLKRSEAIVEGTNLDAEIRALARETARSEITPITDLRSTEGYRRHLTGVLVERALERLADRATSP